jgi:ATP-dependent DNA helicase RecG
VFNHQTIEVTPQATPQVTPQVTGEVTGEVQRLLKALVLKPLTRSESQFELALKGQANFRNRYLEPALKNDLIEMTIPDKPNSRNQKYRITNKGKTLINPVNK